MQTKAERGLTPAYEAQLLFFQIGIEQRTRVARRLSELGLTFPQAHALRLLEPDAPVPMSDLAERLLCDASNITGIADRLEGRGLVERRSEQSDRRVRVLALTDAGAELRERVLALMTEPPAAIAALPLADQRALRDLLRRAVELEAETTQQSGATAAIE
jgi:DNA-binding MarR family transcriptional regulator